MEKALEVRIGELLRARGWRLALAESCTGGLVGHRITEIPGSSDYFMGGIVAYSNDAKERFLQVRRETLNAHGAVSPEAAREMARGARRALKTEVGASVTGIAGPGGGSEAKPVGLTWIGVSTPEGDWVEGYVFEDDRTHNKSQAAQATLELLCQHLETA